MARITPEVSDKVLAQLCAAIAIGNSYDTAARVVGMAPRTLYTWIGKGRDLEEKLQGHKPRRLTRGETFYLEVFTRVRQARAAAINRNIGIIAQAATQSWQAAAWWCERADPKHWARPEVRMELTGPKGGPIKHRLEPSPEAAHAIMQELFPGSVGPLPAASGGQVPTTQ